MLSRHSHASNLVAAFVAAALTLPAGAALAQSSQEGGTHESTARHPQALVESTENPDARHIRLTDRMNVESLNYDHPRGLRICNLTGHVAPANGVANPTRNVPVPLADQAVPLHGPSPVDLKLTYNGQSSQVQPGECYRFRAQDVQVTPAQPLAPGRALELTVENLSGNGSNAQQPRNAQQPGRDSQSNPGETGTPE
ncbi:MAG: hypothetical protein ACREUG_04120 [Steroidobacteraceae bacterium]